jgi:hypothetical protein
MNKYIILTNIIISLMLHSAVGLNKKFKQATSDKACRWIGTAEQMENAWALNSSYNMFTFFGLVHSGLNIYFRDWNYPEYNMKVVLFENINGGYLTRVFRMQDGKEVCRTTQGPQPGLTPYYYFMVKNNAIALFDEKMNIQWNCCGVGFDFYYRNGQIITSLSSASPNYTPFVCDTRTRISDSYYQPRC